MWPRRPPCGMSAGPTGQCTASAQRPERPASGASVFSSVKRAHGANSPLGPAECPAQDVRWAGWGVEGLRRGDWQAWGGPVSRALSQLRVGGGRVPPAGAAVGWGQVRSGAVLGPLPQPLPPLPPPEVRGRRTRQLRSPESWESQWFREHQVQLNLQVSRPGDEGCCAGRPGRRAGLRPEEEDAAEGRAAGAG